jgi:hypothetical protein
MTSAEEIYAQIEKELLAIVWTLERFDTYVYLNKPVTVETDHKPLLAINRESVGVCSQTTAAYVVEITKLQGGLCRSETCRCLICEVYFGLRSTARGGIATSDQLVTPCGFPIKRLEHVEVKFNYLIHNRIYHLPKAIVRRRSLSWQSVVSVC